jgi:ubiquinone/menaquinone biosynthesis C-methylase UbiE
MGFEKQGAKPSGLIGKIIGRLMNKYHTTLYIDYFKNKLPKENSRILDIGCGGGEFLKFLNDSNDSYQLFGLDHSPEMIDLCSKVNKRAIEKKSLKLMQSSVTDIQLKNSQLDLITAFETVQFWPDTEESFLEIYRLLKESGQFLIINRYPPEGSKWWKMAKIKNDKDYIRKLEKAKFNKITVDSTFKNGWIVVLATK